MQQAARKATAALPRPVTLQPLQVRRRSPGLYAVFLSFIPTSIKFVREFCIHQRIQAVILRPLVDEGDNRIAVID